MRSPVKASKKLSELLKLCVKREEFDTSSLTRLLKQPGLKPDPVLLSKTFSVVTSNFMSAWFNRQETTELAQLMFKHWFDGLSWTQTTDFWMQFDKVCTHARKVRVRHEDVASSLEPFIRANYRSIEQSAGHYPISTSNREMMYKVLVDDTMAKTPVSKDELGWTMKFLKWLVRHRAFDIEEDPAINNHNLPFSYRVALIKEALVDSPSVCSTTPYTWFATCADSTKKKSGIALLLAAHGSTGALTYLQDHEEGLADYVEMAISLDIDPHNIVKNARKKQVPILDEQSLPMDF